MVDYEHCFLVTYWLAPVLEGDMAVRETSGEAFSELKDSGALASSQHRVLAALYGCHPATAGELWEWMRSNSNGSRLIDKAKVSARLGELRDLGVAREVETRKCKVTGKRAIAWAVQDELPSVVHVAAVRAAKRKEATEARKRRDKDGSGDARRSGEVAATASARVAYRALVVDAILALQAAEHAHECSCSARQADAIIVRLDDTDRAYGHVAPGAVVSIADGVGA